MVMQAEVSHARVVVQCPETGVALRVHVSREEGGEPHVIGCSRFWGNLRCETTCEPQAVDAFLALCASARERTYCGHPNLAAPHAKEKPVN